MIGRTIGHYEILEKLGEGGMGVVYKARDTQLERFVAIKVLLPDKVANEERKARFIQEAKAASALNHPNIVTIYDVGNEDGADYIVMEYVEGRTLDRLIPAHGLRLADLLKYAIPVADALTRAHAAGIVHRDLKPGNVMVADDGPVKLLDFGLAKLSDLHDTSDADLTRPVRPETSEGSILGTVCYMSPEQAEARKVDGRSDIFSFGAMLYEMATGQRAFMGRSKISTLAAILQSEPKAPAQVHAGLPRELEKIIQRCLRKDPAWRYQSAGDLKISLWELQRDLDSGAASTGPSVEAAAASRRSFAWVAMLAAGIAFGLALAWLIGSRREVSRAVYGPVKPLTTYAGLEYQPALSPDGSQVAFSWDGPQRDNFDIYVRLVEGGAALRLTTDAAPDHAPAWSPDGRHLAFLRDNSIYLIPALGGVERKLMQFARGSLQVSPISWSPDGKFLAFSGAEDAGNASIWVVSTESGEVHRASTLPPGYFYEISPAFSPDGKTLAYIRARDMYSHAVVFQEMNGGTPRGREREITGYGETINELAWQPDGRALILTIRQGGERTGLYQLTVGGALAPLGIESSIVHWPSLSRTGNRLAYEKRLVNTNIYRIDGPGPDGGPRPYEQAHPARVIDSTVENREPMLSPDGRRLLFNSDRGGTYEIHVANADGTAQVALTAMGPTAMGSPRWSPDGQRVAFDRYENGHSMIYTVGAEGGKPVRVTGGAFRDRRPSFSRDGKWIYFGSNRGSSDEIWKVPAGGGEPQQVTHNTGNEAFESPDGTLLYYQNARGLWSLPVAGGEPKLVLSEAPMFLYAVAGRSIYYAQHDPPGIAVLRTDTGRKFEYVRFSKDTIGLDGGTAITVSADERSIFFAQTDRRESDLMLVENFQ